jgi:glycolate oxidase
MSSEQTITDGHADSGGPTGPTGPTDPTAGSTTATLDDLAARLSDGALTTDPDVIDAHASDEALFCPREGAIALVRATSAKDVQEVMRFATEHSVPVVPQGARSGISGGANAMPGAILLNVSKMTEVIAVNPAERLVTVQPGIINQDLKDHLAPYGLSYPPDPGSVALSSIGGNIATNAGGLCCVKYGVTRDYVRSLKVVLADGTITTLGPQTAKGVAGLDMRHLFIGSEGTLGIVVEATLRLIPKLPDPFTAIATFPDERSGLQTVADFMAAGGVPSLVEFLDGSSLRMLNDYGDFGLDAEAGAMLIMQVDQSPTRFGGGDGDLRRGGPPPAVPSTSAYSDDPTDSAALITARRMIQPAYEKFAGAHGGEVSCSTMCACRARPCPNSATG